MATDEDWYEIQRGHMREMLERVIGEWLATHRTPDDEALDEEAVRGITDAVLTEAFSAYDE